MTVFLTRFEAIVCVVVAVVVLGTASRTVGSATFLADQLDQIVSYEAPLDGEAKALYGPAMSGTNPPAQSLAPVAAVLFGLPTALGLNPDRLHVLFLLRPIYAPGESQQALLRDDDRIRMWLRALR
jgi:hypothetical protein